MSSQAETTVNESEPINLKHRITGAGVLIFFGALVLPWLLGPPSEAKKNLDAQSEQAQEQRHSTFEDKVLAELEGTEVNFEEPEETVYVSKITPVNPSGEAPKLVAESPRESADDKGTVKSGDRAATIKSSPDSETKSTEKAKSQQSTGKSETAEAKKEIKQTAAVTNGAAGLGKVEKKSTNTKEKSTTKKAPKQQLAANTKKIDVGWVVQVELLTDKNGAKRLVEELGKKGFKPQTTVVDTNRGAKTGTRIWLGPFEQRAQAGAENDRLETKMGKRGFIRVYP